MVIPMHKYSLSVIFKITCFYCKEFVSTVLVPFFILISYSPVCLVQFFLYYTFVYRDSCLHFTQYMLLAIFVSSFPFFLRRIHMHINICLILHKKIFLKCLFYFYVDVSLSVLTT